MVATAHPWGGPAAMALRVASLPPTSSPNRIGPRSAQPAVMRLIWTRKWVIAQTVGVTRAVPRNSSSPPRQIDQYSTSPHHHKKLKTRQSLPHQGFFPGVSTTIRMMSVLPLA